MYAFGVWEGTGDPKFTGDSVVVYLFNLRVFELRTAFQTRNLCVKREVSAMGEVSGKAWNTGGRAAQNTAISRGRTVQQELCTQHYIGWTLNILGPVARLRLIFC